MLWLCGCDITDSSIKALTKVYQPNMQKFHFGWDKGVSVSCLAYIPEINWGLTELKTSINKKLSIYYFSLVARHLSQQRQLEVKIWAQGVEGKEIMMNANTVLSTWWS